MGMTFKDETPDSLFAKLKRVEDVTSKRALAAMRTLATDIKGESQANAPVDKHNLEEAHHLVEDIGDRRRIEISIEVGGEVGGRDVDEYATVMHEADYNLGPASQLKQVLTGHVVGRKYLERAADSMTGEFNNIEYDIFSDLDL